MTVRELLSLLSLAVAACGFIWGIVRWYAGRERSANEARINEAWDKIEGFQAELAQAKQDLAVLKARVEALPDGEVLRVRFEGFETKMERKLETLGESIQNSMKALTDGMIAGVVAALRSHEARRP